MFFISRTISLSPSQCNYGITDFKSQSYITGVLRMFQPPREDKGAGNCKISLNKYLMDLGLSGLSPTSYRIFI